MLILLSQKVLQVLQVNYYIAVGQSFTWEHEKLSFGEGLGPLGMGVKKR